MEITSPGRFPGVVDLTDPAEISRFARNPRIARFLADLDFGQELGEGIRRMFEEMRLAGLAEPSYHQSSTSVRLTLSAEPVDRALEDRVSSRGRELVRAIRDAGRLSTGDLVKITGHSRQVVLRDLNTPARCGRHRVGGRQPQGPSGLLAPTVTGAARSSQPTLNDSQRQR